MRRAGDRVRDRFNLLERLSHRGERLIESFGELPNPFTAAQRLWVTVSIYLTVIGWAYAIGSLLSLLQDRAFRQALDLILIPMLILRNLSLFLKEKSVSGPKTGIFWLNKILL